MDAAGEGKSSSLNQGAENWADAQISFEGQTHACLQHVTSQTRISAFVTETEVIVDHWWYQPQYDAEPNTRIERHGITGFLNGEGQAGILSSCGPRALDRIQRKCRAREPQPSDNNIHVTHWVDLIGTWIRRIGHRNTP